MRSQMHIIIDPATKSPLSSIYCKQKDELNACKYTSLFNVFIAFAF